MEINKNNYQIWISDYYDGALSESGIAMLFRFLDLYPELRDEFNSYGEMVLHPDISIRMNKDSLRKELGSENTDAIEHCALLYSEKELAPELEMEFKELLERSKKAKSEAAIYSSLKLSPDNITYPDKTSLKRIPYRLSFGRSAIRILAVAASLALIISLAVFLPREAENSYSYNTAYLLPFNNSELYPERVNAEHSSLVNPGRVALKEINIQERAVKEPLVAEQVERQEIFVDESPFITGVSLLYNSRPESLLAMNNADPEMIDIPGQSLSPRQFVAMNFRKHLLKEDIEKSDRLKAYEVADVSIEGLNKLLGWNMVFEKEKTEDGRLASFKFTSQLLNLDHKNKKVAD